MLSLLAKLGLDVGPFQRGLETAKGSAKKAGDQIASSFGNNLKASLFGVVAGGGAMRLASAVTALAAQAKKMASDFGVTTDEAQQLAVASERSGGSIEETGAALTKVAQLRAKILAGDEKAVALAQELGLKTGDLTDGLLSNLDVLRQISNAAEQQGGSYAAQNAAVQMLGEKAGAVFSTMAALKNLGPIPLISSSDIDELVRAKATLEEMNRTLLLAAAPRVGFWARVLNRGDQLEREHPKQWFNFSRATWAELIDTGPTSSAALTSEEILKARQKISGANLPLPDTTDTTKPSATARSVSAITAGSPPSAGNLASSGLFFGGAGSGLYREARQQTGELQKVNAALKWLPRAIADEL